MILQRRDLIFAVFDVSFTVVLNVKFEPLRLFTSIPDNGHQLNQGSAFLE